ncbi:MAG: efflux RND transporter periplasmic adaptor subunit [Bacteroidales bacterium]
MSTIRFAILSMALLLLSCGKGVHSEGEVREVNVLELKQEDVTLSKSYSASIRGQQDIKIIPRVEGYLTDILIKEGEIVKKGQPLFIIDQVSFNALLQASKASVAVGEANVSTAKLTYDSKKALFDKSIISDFDLLQAENSYKTAQAQLMQAKAELDIASNNLSFTVVKSPSDGVAGKIPYRIGDYVSPAIQNGLTVVADNSNMFVYFSLVERQVMELVSKYKSLALAIDSMPEIQLQLCDGSIYSHSGRVESISGLIDPSTGAVSIRSVFPNQDRLLLSGGSGSVVIPQSLSGVIVIPQEATFEIQDKTYVYKVVDGVTQSAIISVERISNGKEYIVTNGLDVNDTIVADGAGLLREGMKVSVTRK